MSDEHIQRYGIGAAGGIRPMAPYPLGDWVKYRDHLATMGRAVHAERIAASDRDGMRLQQLAQTVDERDAEEKSAERLGLHLGIALRALRLVRERLVDRGYEDGCSLLAMIDSGLAPQHGLNAGLHIELTPEGRKALGIDGA